MLGATCARDIQSGLFDSERQGSVGPRRSGFSAHLGHVAGSISRELHTTMFGGEIYLVRAEETTPLTRLLWIESDPLKTVHWVEHFHGLGFRA